MWSQLASAIFLGDRQWAWRRRVALTSALTMHVGIIYAIFFDKDLAHATMVMSNCVTGMIAVLTVYVGGVVADDNLKRRRDNEAGHTRKPAGDNPDANGD